MEEDDQNNNICFGDSDVFLDIKSIRYLNTIEEDTLGLAQNTNGIQNSLQDDKKQEVKMASTEAGYKLSQAPTECRQINQPGASIGGSGNHEPTLFSIQIDQPQLESELTRNLPDKPFIETDIGSLELALTECGHNCEGSKFLDTSLHPYTPYPSPRTSKLSTKSRKPIEAFSRVSLSPTIFTFKRRSFKNQACTHNSPVTSGGTSPAKSTENCSSAPVLNSVSSRSSLSEQRLPMSFQSNSDLKSLVNRSSPLSSIDDGNEETSSSQATSDLSLATLKPSVSYETGFYPSKGRRSSLGWANKPRPPPAFSHFSAAIPTADITKKVNRQGSVSEASKPSSTTRRNSWTNMISGIFGRRSSDPCTCSLVTNCNNVLPKYSDKGKSILSRNRAQDWGANDAFEDGYLENTVADKRGYESDPSDKLDRNLQQAPLSNPFSQRDSPSDYLTPLEDIPFHPTLVAETTQGSSSTPSSMTPKIAVLSSPLEEVRPDIQDDDGSDISSVIDTEVRKEAESFHDILNANY
ncbi:uncharacterized protein LOC134844924 [Symsagittifera roscoffensis]|uniref:uncharacterized protein LOC134844924 n=1 Tax=Symsagittifera roscoffensis TaxID=84072 RepID=UPI00307B3FE5